MSTPSQCKKELQSLYYFDCDCPRCFDSEVEKSMNSMKCSNKNCDGFIYVDEVKFVMKITSHHLNVSLHSNFAFMK